MSNPVVSLHQHQVRIPVNSITEMHNVLSSIPSNVDIFDCMIGACEGHRVLCLSISQPLAGYACVPLANANHNTANLLSLDYLFEQLASCCSNRSVVKAVVSVPQNLDKTYIAISVSQNDLHQLDSIEMCKIERLGQARLLPLLRLSIPFDNICTYLEKIGKIFNNAFAHTYSAVSCNGYLQMDIVPYIRNFDSYRYQSGLPQGWSTIVQNVESDRIGRQDTVALACRANQTFALNEIRDLIKHLHDRGIDITALMPIPVVPADQSFKYALQ